ncbi:hypothetical protein KIL84_015605 [Mauremys mutica]|uniref:Uncharacterized protein n=1 Tax=Mauremys mutica TaxID=74926 RepID=A0A9D3WSA3_9SAUR|nr:hypothetical protein KIL84_015605 [Mauremys mutica]
MPKFPAALELQLYVAKQEEGGKTVCTPSFPEESGLTVWPQMSWRSSLNLSRSHDHIITGILVSHFSRGQRENEHEGFRYDRASSKRKDLRWTYGQCDRQLPLH